MAAASPPLSWLTVEFALWGLLFVIALGLRLSRLDAAPLATSEARGALAALQFARGEGSPTDAAYSPALFGAQWIGFLLFNANEVAARLLPALAGSALALAPVLLRRQLGRTGALGAGLLLALSPTSVALSRTASGDVLVALGALAAAAGLLHLLTGSGVDERETQDDAPVEYAEPVRDSPPGSNREAGDAAAVPPVTDHVPAGGYALERFTSLRASTRRFAEATQLHVSPTTYLIPAGVALALASSALAYSALLSMGLALALLLWFDRCSLEWLKHNWNALRATRNASSYLLGVFLGGFVLLSTAFAWHLGGLGAAATLLPRWLSGFVRWPGSLSPAYPALILALYEPLVVLLGAAGVVVAALRTPKPVVLFLAFWGLFTVLLAFARPGHTAGDVLLTVIPLACLGGITLAALIQAIHQRGLLSAEGLYLMASIPLWTYLLLNLATYTSQAGQLVSFDLLFARFGLPTYLSLSVLTLLVLLFFALVIAFVQGIGPAVRGLGLSVSLVLLVFTLSTTWGISRNRTVDPRELLVIEPTATEVRLMKESLARISLERTGAPHAIDVTVLMEDPVLEWELRDFPTHVAELPGAPVRSGAVIAPATLDSPPVAGGFIGQVFPLRRSWPAQNLGCTWYQAQTELGEERQLDCASLMEWLLYRRDGAPPHEERVVLWIAPNQAGR